MNRTCCGKFGAVISRRAVSIPVAGLLVAGLLTPETARADCVVNGAPPPNFVLDNNNNNVAINLDTGCPGAPTGNQTLTIPNGITQTSNSNLGTIQENTGNATWDVTVSGTVSNTLTSGFFLRDAGSSVTINGTGIVNANGNGVRLNGGGTLNVSGQVTAGTGGFGDGVQINNGVGTVTVFAGGSLTGGTRGITANAAAPTTVSNAGMIRSTTLSAIGLSGSGTVINQTGGTITSTNSIGISISGGTAVVSNRSGATITGVLSGVGVNAGGTITNDAGGTITGNTGVRNVGATPVTIISGGTITGNTGPAIEQGTGDDVVELRPGFVMNGTVLGNGGTDTLRFGGTGSATFDVSLIDTGANTQQYRSFETFSKTGTGTWTLTGTNAGLTAFAIDQGSLIVNGTLANAAFTIGNGGTFGGSGTIGALTAGAGATIAPGNSIGTTIVNGALVLNSGSTLLIEVTPTEADRIVAAGGVTINAGSTLQVVELAGASLNGVGPVTFVIIDNQGGTAVNGAFTTVTETLPFSTVAVTTTGGDGNDVAITISPVVTALATTASAPVTFASVAHTRNQFSVGSGLDTGFFAGGVANGDEQEVANALVGLSAPGARDAFDRLSGEIHPGVSNALLAAAIDMSNALSQRGAGLRDRKRAGDPFGYAALIGTAASVADIGLRFAPEPAEAGEVDAADTRYSPALETWATGIGRIADVDATTGAGSVDEAAYGFIGGVDMNLWRGVRAGIAAGYGHLDVNVGSRVSSADVDWGTLASYLSYQDGGFHLFGSASYSFGFVDTTRAISFGGLSRTANADYNSHQAMLYSEAGYTRTFGAFNVQPVLAARYTHLNRESFRETGAGSLNLIAGSETDNRLDAIAGLRISSSHDLSGSGVDGVRLVPQAKIFYSHAFGAVEGNADFSFSGGGAVNRIVSSNRGRDTLSLGLGASLIASERLSGYVDYQANLSKHAVDNSFKGGITIRF